MNEPILLHLGTVREEGGLKIPIFAEGPLWVLVSFGGLGGGYISGQYCHLAQMYFDLNDRKWWKLLYDEARYELAHLTHFC